MKRFVLAVAALIFSLSLTINEAEAARLGGGKSFGMSRNSTARPASPPPSQNAAPASTPASPAAAAPRSGMSRWLGPVAGLAAGLGLAAMFSHFGMGAGVANFMMIALLAMAAVFLFRWLSRSRQTPAPAGHVPMAFDAQPQSLAQPSKVGAGGTASGIPGVPADFDVAGFLRQAKLNFVRMQAANDRGDLDDIRQFTAPEVFAEIQLQIQERGKAPQQTDVVQLNAELLEISSDDQRHIASVRYFGQLREDSHGAPQDFAEVWHLSKPVDGSRGWQVAGIQQLH